MVAPKFSAQTVDQRAEHAGLVFAQAYSVVGIGREPANVRVYVPASSTFANPGDLETFIYENRGNPANVWLIRSDTLQSYDDPLSRTMIARQICDDSGIQVSLAPFVAAAEGHPPEQLQAPSEDRLPAMLGRAIGMVSGSGLFGDEISGQMSPEDFSFAVSDMPGDLMANYTPPQGSEGPTLLIDRDLLLPENEGKLLHAFVHEIIHYAGWLARGSALSGSGLEFLSEGLTDLYATWMIESQTGEEDRFIYEIDARIALALTIMLGEDGPRLLWQSYASGDFGPVRAALDKVLYEGAFDEMARRGNADPMEALLMLYEAARTHLQPGM